MSGGYHASSSTDGVPVRSMRQFFELALQLEPPWRVVSSDWTSHGDESICASISGPSLFPYPQYGCSCQAIEFTEGIWSHPDVMAFEAFVTARLP